MSKFNLKKYAQAVNAVDNSKSIPKQLDDLRKEYSQQPPEEGNTELQLIANQHKDNDATVPFNKQLSAVRTGTSDGISEKQLNKAPKLYNEKRDDASYGRGVAAVNLMSEGYDQKKIKAWQEVQKGQTRDTSFWDEKVGVQLIGEPTKIVANDQPSQLQNQPDRFSGLKEDLSNEKEYNEFVEASLNHSDKMLFHIFANAASLGRKLTSEEKQQVTDINSGKARILAAFDQNYPQSPVSSEKTQQQFQEAMPTPDTSSSTPEPPIQPAMPGSDVIPGSDQSPFSETDGAYTIEPSGSGYAIYKVPSNGGEKELVRDGFETSQDAHTFADHDPELDRYDFQEDGANVPQTAGNPKDFSPIQENKPVTSPSGIPQQPQKPQGI